MHTEVSIVHAQDAEVYQHLARAAACWGLAEVALGAAEGSSTLLNRPLTCSTAQAYHLTLCQS